MESEKLELQFLVKIKVEPNYRYHKQQTNNSPNFNQPQSEHKHSLTFHNRRYVVITKKSMHRLQICPTLPFPQVISGSVQQCGNAARDTQTDTQKDETMYISPRLGLTRNVTIRRSITEQAVTTQYIVLQFTQYSCFNSNFPHEKGLVGCPLIETTVAGFYRPDCPPHTQSTAF